MSWQKLNGLVMVASAERMCSSGTDRLNDVLMVVGEAVWADYGSKWTGYNKGVKQSADPGLVKLTACG